MRLPIVKYGNPILRAKGKRIEQVDERIRALAADMLETMHAANGVGLAAQQVGAALQLTVLDISQVEDRPSTMKLNGEEVDPAERDASRPAQSENSIWTKRSLPGTKVVSVFRTSPPKSIARFPSRWKRRRSREKRSGLRRRDYSRARCNMRSIT